MRVWVNPDFRGLFDPKTIFEDMQAMHGQIFREGKGRVTLRFEWQGQYFFLKRHSGIGWYEIFKDLLQGRLPIIGAFNEWRALERLQILNISTLQSVAWGERGFNPATRYSFLVTRELKNTISLEELVTTWQQREDFIHIKRAIIRQVARLAQRMHRNGINHRDMYICHLHVSKGWLKYPANDPELFVIDLHRAQIRRSVPQRWLVKDIASLDYSSMEAGLNKTDRLRFVKDYSGTDLRTTLHRDAKFWADVRQRANRLYAKRPNPGLDINT